MSPDELFKQIQTLHQQVAANPLSKPEDWENLRRSYSMALSAMPDHPIALFGLGTVYMQIGEAGAAIAFLHRCMEKGGKGASPWLNLGAAWKVDHNDDQARECYHKAVEQTEIEFRQKSIDETVHKQDLTHAYHGMASLYINAGEPDLCIHWCDKALAIDPKERFALWNKGLAHLERGDWAEGFRLYDEAGFIAEGRKPMERKLKTYGGLPKWNGEPGKTVICYGEQGVGDEIMFASMIPDLMKEAKVILDVDKRIPNILRRSFPAAVGIHDTSSIDDPFPWLDAYKTAGHDLCWFPMGSLGKRYRKRASDFPKTPYLIADPECRQRWSSILESFKGLKIGISWAGGLKKTRTDMRSMRLKEWEPILTTPGAHFFSLQYHSTAADECADVGRNLNVPIHHWGDMIRNWDEMAAFVSEMDLIITVNTSLHHLAGALGTEQWCLTPKMVAWRYGVSGPSPWYGNCTMYRQKKSKEWKPVVEKAAHDLRSKVQVKMIEVAA
jgi:tetratricopeptide (TPR) repeat protein